MISELALVLVILFLGFMILYERRQAKIREDDLIAGIMANSVKDYVLAHDDLRTSSKKRIKEIKAKAEADLLIQQDDRDRGVPLS